MHFVNLHFPYTCEEIRIIHEEHNRRRRCGDLHAVVNSARPGADRRRGQPQRGVVDDLVENGRGDAASELGGGAIY